MARRRKFPEDFQIPDGTGYYWYCLTMYDSSALVILKWKCQRDRRWGDVLEVYIPTRTVRKMYRGKVADREEKPYGYYLFMKAKMSGTLYWNVNEVPGLAWVNTDTDNVRMPPIVPEEEIERIQMEMAAIDEEAIGNIKVGEIVEITQGPLKNYGGPVIKMAKHGAVVEVFLFGRKNEIEVPFANVRVVS